MHPLDVHRKSPVYKTDTFMAHVNQGSRAPSGGREEATAFMTCFLAWTDWISKGPNSKCGVSSSHFCTTLKFL